MWRLKVALRNNFNMVADCRQLDQQNFADSLRCWSKVEELISRWDSERERFYDGIV